MTRFAPAIPVIPQLVVFDALPHAFWCEFRLPESKEANQMVANFFNKHLGM